MKNLIFICVLTVTLIYSSPLVAKVYHTRDSALKNAFSDADTIEKKTLFLDDEDVKKIEALAKVKLDTKIFTFYIGKKKEAVLGYVIFGSHVIRTKPEVYMVVINPDASIKFVEILAFYEPEEYLPIKKWFEEINGFKRGRDLFCYDVDTKKGYSDDVNRADVIFISVPTPPNPDGSCNTTIVEQAVASVRDGKIVVIKSTVPPGTAKKCDEIIKDI